MEREQTRPYTKPTVSEEGDVNELTQGGEGPKTEPGDNIVWGTIGVTDPGPREID
jgi:hypothetical protein